MQNEVLSRRSPSKEGAVVYWLPLLSALAHFEVSRSEIVRAVKEGELRSRRIVCGDDLAVALSSAELLERYPRRPEPVVPESPAGSKALIPIDVLREQATELARVQAHLEAAERVERSLHRYADRLEAELRAARRESMALAHALGVAEGIERGRAEQLAGARVVSVS